jgi:hypothetical protein
MIQITPASIVLTQGQVFSFSATDQGGQPVTALWALAPATGAGTIGPNDGAYQAPAAVTARVPISVQATVGTEVAHICSHATAAGIEHSAGPGVAARRRKPDVPGCNAWCS